MGSLNGLLHKLVGSDQHAYWMIKPISNLDKALSEMEVDTANFGTNFTSFFYFFASLCIMPWGLLGKKETSVGAHMDFHVLV